VTGTNGHVTVNVLLMVNHNDFCTLINNILTKFMAINCIAFANELFEKIRVKQVIGTLDINVTDITTDSRTASEVPITCLTRIFSNNSFAFKMYRSFFYNNFIIHVLKLLINFNDYKFINNFKTCIIKLL
jgi:predicted RNA-binding protein